MKNILTIKPDELEFALKKMTISAIKQLLVNIREITSGMPFNQEMLCDLNRKETKCWKELQARKYLTQKDYNDFFKWLNKARTKKIF